MPGIIHPLAGLIAILMTVTFWLSTVFSQLFASEMMFIAVKLAIPWGFLLLVPALFVASGSGFFLSKGQRQGLINAKFRRMPFIGANTLLVMLPAALFLSFRAMECRFDTTFYAMQILELIAGATNIALLVMNMRDGLKLTQWRRKSLRSATACPVQMISRREVARGTLVLHLSRPEGFRFTAGQAVYLSLPDLKKADAAGRIRTFSIASAPQNTELEIATRQTSTSFKHYLAEADARSAFQLEGPYGDLTLHEDASRPAVFLTGGIGITPFRSIILDATYRALPHHLFLFYSNRTPEDTAFLTELRECEQKNPRFRLIITFTDDDTTPTDGTVEHGYITADMLKKYIGDLIAPVFYVTGPPVMVSAMEQMLKEAGVSEKSVRTEKFTGY